MKLDDIWIGDVLKIKSQNVIGIFLGIHQNGQAKIKVNDEIFYISAGDLEPWIEEDKPVDWKFLSLEEDQPSKGFKPIKKNPELFDGVIDLHFEKLAPERLLNPPPHILEFQLLKCREFIEKAIALKVTYIRIIHGRGEGKLKAGVEHLLLAYREVNSFYSTPDVGALEVRLQFIHA